MSSPARDSTATSSARRCTRILEGILQRDEGGRRIYGDPARVRYCRRVRDARARARRGCRDGRGAPSRVRRRSPCLPRRRDDSARAPRARADDALDAVAGRGGRPAHPRAARRARASRTLEDEARAVADAYGPLGSGPLPGTTHISVVDGDGHGRGALVDTRARDRASSAAVPSSTTCSASSTSSATGEKAPGDRLASMMTPTLVLDARASAARDRKRRSVRLAGAIAQVTWRFLRGTHVADAIRGAAAPRRGRRRSTSRAGGPTRRSQRSPRDLGRQPLGRSEPLLRRRAGGRADAPSDASRLRATRAAGAGDRRRMTTVRRATPHDAQRARRAGRERRARGRDAGSSARDPGEPPADERRYLRTVERYPDAAVFVAEDGEQHRRPALALAGPAPGEQARRRPRAHGRGEPPPAGSRHAAPRARRSLGRASAACSKLELHVFPWNEPALAPLRGVRFRARGLPEAALRARRRARRRHPDGVLRRGRPESS